MEKITWRTQRKYFQEFNIIYSNSAIAFEMVSRRAAALNGRINLSAVRRFFFFCHRPAEWLSYYF